MKKLVAFYSRADENYFSGALRRVQTGNTEKAARMIAEAQGADLFRIQTLEPLPEGYEACVAVTKKEWETKARPALSRRIESLAQYGVVYLGYPIWFSDMPMAVYSLLESCDFSGKTIIPFCTHEGSGLSSTVKRIQQACPSARVLPGLALKGSVVQDDPKAARAEIDRFLEETAMKLS